VTEWDEYVKLFRNARDQIATGEASPSYFWLPSAAGAIHAQLPEARLIFLLRDPANRLFSWYLMALDRHPELTFRTWFYRWKDSGRHRGPPADGYPLELDGGRYGTHLQRFLKLFPRDHVRVYLYESFRSDTLMILRDIFAFLSVDSTQPIDVSRRHNETLALRFPTLHRLRRRVLGSASLTSWLPRPAQRALRRFYRGRRRDTMAPEDRGMVIDFLREEILRAADLIGRDLSSWLR
jgi:hypothetical protein